MKHTSCIIIGACLLSPVCAQARPVSYPGGWTFMTTHDVESNATHIHYSPSAKYSVGWRHEYMRDQEVNVDSVQLNNILKRWNAPDSQANLYLKSSAGIAYDSHQSDLALSTGLAADWENRRYFVSYENHFFWAGNDNKHIKHKARVGIAPYIGNYGDIHTWLMLQTDYDAGEKDSFSATPLVRLFKGADMVEAGYNLDHGILFNYVHRF